MISVVILFLIIGLVLTAGKFVIDSQFKHESEIKRWDAKLEGLERIMEEADREIEERTLFKLKAELAADGRRGKIDEDKLTVFDALTAKVCKCKRGTKGKGCLAPNCFVRKEQAVKTDPNGRRYVEVKDVINSIIEEQKVRQQRELVYDEIRLKGSAWEGSVWVSGNKIVPLREGKSEGNRKSKPKTPKPNITPKGQKLCPGCGKPSTGEHVLAATEDGFVTCRFRTDLPKCPECGSIYHKNCMKTDLNKEACSKDFDTKTGGYRYKCVCSNEKCVGRVKRTYHTKSHGDYTQYVSVDPDVSYCGECNVPIRACLCKLKRELELKKAENEARRRERQICDTCGVRGHERCEEYHSPKCRGYRLAFPNSCVCDKAKETFEKAHKVTNKKPDVFKGQEYDRFLRCHDCDEVGHASCTFKERKVTHSEKCNEYKKDSEKNGWKLICICEANGIQNRYKPYQWMQ
jgi:hypothetical protein